MDAIFQLDKDKNIKESNVLQSTNVQIKIVSTLIDFCGASGFQVGKGSPRI